MNETRIRDTYIRNQPHKVDLFYEDVIQISWCLRCQLAFEPVYTQCPDCTTKFLGIAHRSNAEHHRNNETES